MPGSAALALPSSPNLPAPRWAALARRTPARGWHGWRKGETRQHRAADRRSRRQGFGVAALGKRPSPNLAFWVCQHRKPGESLPTLTQRWGIACFNLHGGEWQLTKSSKGTAGCLQPGIPICFAYSFLCLLLQNYLWILFQEFLHHVHFYLTVIR